MRFTTPGNPGDFRAHVIAGTRVILIALDLSQEMAKGLAGFAAHPKTPLEEMRQRIKSCAILPEDLKNPHALGSWQQWPPSQSARRMRIPTRDSLGFLPVSARPAPLISPGPRKPRCQKPCD